MVGKEHPDYAASLCNLAAVYYEEGNLEKAKVLFEEALPIYERVYGKDNINTKTVQENLESIQ